MDHTKAYLVESYELGVLREQGPEGWAEDEIVWLPTIGDVLGLLDWKELSIWAPQSDEERYAVRDQTVVNWHGGETPLIALLELQLAEP